MKKFPSPKGSWLTITKMKRKVRLKRVEGNFCNPLPTLRKNILTPIFFCLELSEQVQSPFF